MVGAVDSCPQRCARFVALLVVVLVALVAPAHAATLSWHAPTGCPDVASVRARIERRLDRSLDDVSVPVDIEVSRRAGRYIARVDLGALTVANDVRTLTSRRCSELADAVAVIVARVASEALAAPPPPPSPATTPASVAPGPRVAVRDVDEPEVTARSAEPLVSQRPALRPWTLGVRISGLSGIGIIPEVGLGGELAVTMRAGSHLAELGAARWAASAAQLHDGRTAPIDIDLEVAVARYGWRPAVMPLRAWVAVEVGSMMRHSSVTLPIEPIDDGQWVAAGGGFGVAWQMTKWARLVGTTEVMLAIERARFGMTDGTIIYAPAPMSVRTSCGLEVGWQ